MLHTLTRRVVLAALVSFVVLTSCGGDQNDDEASGTAPTTAETDVGAEAPNAAAPSGCPLTDEQVSDALGEPVAGDPATCTFYPTGDSNTPNAAYNQQVEVACDDPGSAGYQEPVDGLGVDAFAQPGTAIGTMLLVCTSPPFEITVDMSGDTDGALAAATTLASLVLDGA